MASPKKFTIKEKRILEQIASKTPSVLPFLDDTPKGKKDRIARVENGNSWDDFSWYCVTYFPHIFTRGFCDSHRIMWEETEAATDVIAITGFRSLGKTAMMGVVYAIWKIIRGERYIIQAASDIDQSIERTSFMKHEFKNNKRLTSDFPDLRPEDDDEINYYLKNNTRVRARSIKQATRGTINPRTAKRPGLIVCDDIDKEENVGSQKIGNRKMKKIIEEMGGSLDPDHPGKVLWLGNLTHPNYGICQLEKGIIEEMKKDGNVDDDEIRSMRILKIDGKMLMRFPLENKDGTSAWEERFPTAELPKIRAKYGVTGYQREMLGKAVIDGNIFKYEWFTKYQTLPEACRIKRVWMYADPAWGEKGCYKSIFAIAYDGFTFYVVKCWVRQTENTKFFRYFYDVFHEMDRTYRAKFRAAIEITYGQSRMLQDFDRWCQSNNLPTISHRIKGIDNRENKNLRIEATETPIETAKVVFPEGQDTPVLIAQYLTYPEGYVDGPDGLAGTLERFNEYDRRRGRIRVRRMGY